MSEPQTAMTMDDMVLISVDDHIIEPPDMFIGRMPERFRDAAPRVARFANGDERWMVEGWAWAGVGSAAVAGRKREELGDEPSRYSEIRPGCWNVDARIDEMNANGTLASVNFSSLFGFSGEKLVSGTDKDLMLALVRAYNDWHLEDWAGRYPGRLIANCILPLWDLELAIAELERIADAGVGVVSFPENPTAFGQPSIHWGHWDRLFAKIVERDMAVAIHIGTSGGLLPTPSLESPADVGVTLLNIKTADAVADLLFSPLLLKFPALRIMMSEGCMGWVPFLRERANAEYRNHRYWTHADLGDLLPSDLLARHFLFCFHEDDFGLSVRHQVGIDQIAWECDYPHADSTWPRSPELLWASLKDFPQDEIEKISWGNAARFLNFDPFAHTSRAAATVGALRAKAGHVDLAPLPGGGLKPVRTRSILSAADIYEMYQQGNARLGEPVGYLT
jgi:predicted TIM-barrel fold metal-dependent hydrolase